MMITVVVEERRRHSHTLMIEGRLSDPAPRGSWPSDRPDEHVTKGESEIVSELRPISSQGSIAYPQAKLKKGRSVNLRSKPAARVVVLNSNSTGPVTSRKLGTSLLMIFVLQHLKEARLKQHCGKLVLRGRYIKGRSGPPHEEAFS